MLSVMVLSLGHLAILLNNNTCMYLSLVNLALISLPRAGHHDRRLTIELVQTASQTVMASE